jgi:hypothetical protein
MHLILMIKKKCFQLLLFIISMLNTQIIGNVKTLFNKTFYIVSNIIDEKYFLILLTKKKNNNT